MDKRHHAIEAPSVWWTAVLLRCGGHARSSRSPCRFRKRREFFVHFPLGRIMPAVIDELRRLLDQDVELDHFAARDVKEESGRGIRRARHEDRGVFLLWLGRWTVMSDPGGVDKNTSHHMPGAGNSTRPTVRNVDPDFENRVSNTCFRPR